MMMTAVRAAHPCRPACWSDWPNSLGSIRVAPAPIRKRLPWCRPPHGATGLFHLAILYPDRRSLADALRRLMNAGIRLDGASDHGVSEALYLRDPDHNGVELYWDRPENLWPRTADGTLNMYTKQLDLEGLLGTLEKSG